jgi:hypothetical protein
VPLFPCTFLIVSRRRHRFINRDLFSTKQRSEHTRKQYAETAGNSHRRLAVRHFAKDVDQRVAHRTVADLSPEPDADGGILWGKVDMPTRKGGICTIHVVPLWTSATTESAVGAVGGGEQPDPEFVRRGIRFSHPVAAHVSMRRVKCVRGSRLSSVLTMPAFGGV